MSNNDAKFANLIYADVENLSFEECCDYLQWEPTSRNRYYTQVIERLKTITTEPQSHHLRTIYNKVKDAPYIRYSADNLLYAVLSHGGFAEAELVKMARGSKTEHAKMAMRQLGHLGESFFIPLIDKKYPGIRICAIEILISLGWRDAEKVCKILKDAKAREAESVSELLAKMGDRRAIGTMIEKIEEGGVWHSPGPTIMRHVCTLVKNDPDLKF